MNSSAKYDFEFNYVIGIFVIARIIEKFMRKSEIEKIYASADTSTEAHILYSSIN